MRRLGEDRGPGTGGEGWDLKPRSGLMGRP